MSLLAARAASRRSKANPWKEKILEVATDYDVYLHFFSKYVPGINSLFIGAVKSPLREDSKPSLSFIVASDGSGKILYKDHAIPGKQGAGDVFRFVKEILAYREGLDLNFHEVLQYISKDMGLGVFDDTPSFVSPTKNNEEYTERLEAQKVILIQSGAFTQEDLQYWSAYGVSKAMLDLYNVTKVYRVLDENHYIRMEFRPYKKVYAYNILGKYKIYQPMSEKFKWYGNCPKEYVQGVEQLQGHDTLVITKSLKDIMCMRGIDDSVDYLAPHSETTPFTPEWVAWIKSKYKRILVIYDSDAAGIQGAELLRTLLDCDVDYIHKDPEVAKDLSDAYLYLGKAWAVDRYREILKYWKEKWDTPYQINNSNKSVKTDCPF